jgi:hypothetical protein
MNKSGLEFIEKRADSVLDLLIAQCADLEALLRLARCETQAAEANDFDEIMRVVSDRATLGERLEVYHRQVADLRLRLGEAADPVSQGPMARQVTTLAMEIMAEDARTRPLLLAARGELAGKQQQLDKSQRGVSAYLQDGRRMAVACDERV